MRHDKADFKLLTNHAHVLLYLHAHPEATLRKVAFAIGLTERAVQLMVADLESAGYLVRRKVGRQNQYSLEMDRMLQHPLESSHKVGDFLGWAHPPESDYGDADRALENWTVGEHGSEVK